MSKIIALSYATVPRHNHPRVALMTAQRREPYGHVIF